MVPLARQVLVCACVFTVHSFSRHGAQCDGNFERSSDISYANFARHLFQYLNVTKLGVHLGGKVIDCAQMCVDNFRCFSFNVAANADAHGHLVCELLASDKYNHSDKLVPHADFHHYSIQVSFFFHLVTLSCSWCQNIIKFMAKALSAIVFFILFCRLLALRTLVKTEGLAFLCIMKAISSANVAWNSKARNARKVGCHNRQRNFDK